MPEFTNGNNAVVAVPNAGSPNVPQEGRSRYKVPPKQFKTVAVPMEIWEDLWALSEHNQRSPAKQIEFLVRCAATAPTDREILERYARLCSDSGRTETSPPIAGAL